MTFVKKIKVRNSATSMSDYPVQFRATVNKKTPILSTHNILKLSFKDFNAIKSQKITQIIFKIFAKIIQELLDR